MHNRSTLTNLPFLLLFALAWASAAQCAPDTNVASRVVDLDETILVRGLDFSPDGTLLAAASSFETINIWNWREKRVVRKLEKTAGASSGLTTRPMRFSPDGTYFATCHDGGKGEVVIRVWRTDTWAIVTDIGDPILGGCSAIDFTPDGQYLVRTTMRNPNRPACTLCIYSTRDWTLKRGLSTIPFYPSALAISPDGALIAMGGTSFQPSGSQTEEIRIVNTEDTGSVRVIPETMALHFGQLSWSPDSKRLAAAGRRAWDGGANGGHGQFTGAPDNFAIFEVATGRKLSGEQWGKQVSRYSLAFSPDGRYLLEGGTDGSGVKIWDNQHMRLLQGIDVSAGSVSAARGGPYFAVGSEGKITVWKFE
ncbi:hypothetical protein VVD49_03675 [Uliginosibacterium sp. H3]|uniref:WD40 repeat domain-containing protein n=1 Tax=Uliginosibacterium silvisoli TaxID=3114758 RepID=A0ABU6JZM4_9RHOO|nr:hypothetical protein [Uliginosibacterium sp. H3]